VQTLAATVVHENTWKLAVTVVADVVDTVHVPAPLQPPPDQPANFEPASAVAVKTTLVP
jgi:hypothetical protein